MSDSLISWLLPAIESAIWRQIAQYKHFVLCVPQRIVMTPLRMIDLDKEDIGRLVCSGWPDWVWSEMARKDELHDWRAVPRASILHTSWHQGFQ